MTDATKEWFGTQAEQGQPTDSGEWCVVPLAQLIEQGYEYLEVHFEDGSRNGEPNCVRVSREDGS